MENRMSPFEANFHSLRETAGRHGREACLFGRVTNRLPGSYYFTTLGSGAEEVGFSSVNE